MHSDTPRQVHATGSQKLQRKIASFAGQDREKQVEGCPAQLAGARRIDTQVYNREGRVFLRINSFSEFSYLRQMLDVAKILIEIRNPNSRTDVLQAHMIEQSEHVFEQTHLPRVGRCEIGMTALGTVSQVGRSVPSQKGLSQPSAWCDHGNGPSRNCFSGVNCGQIAWLQDGDRTG